MDENMTEIVLGSSLDHLLNPTTCMSLVRLEQGNSIPLRTKNRANKLSKDPRRPQDQPAQEEGHQQPS